MSILNGVFAVERLQARRSAFPGREKGLRWSRGGGFPPWQGPVSSQRAGLTGTPRGRIRSETHWSGVGRSERTLTQNKRILAHLAPGADRLERVPDFDEYQGKRHERQRRNPKNSGTCHRADSSSAFFNSMRPNEWGARTESANVVVMVLVNLVRHRYEQIACPGSGGLSSMGFVTWRIGNAPFPLSPQGAIFPTCERPRCWAFSLGSS